MSSTESQVDKELVEHMLEWTDGIDEFERHHAVDGLFLARGFTVPPFTGDKEGFLLLALDVAFWCWIDDRSDKHLLESSVRFDWNRILELAEGKSPPSSSIRILDQEEIYYQRLSRAMEDRASDKTEHDFWQQTMFQVAQGMFFEEQVNRSGQRPSFAECIEYGFASTGLPNFFAASGLIYGVSRSARQADMILTQLERCFCIQQRMLNDINGIEKERQEGVQGKLSNSVLMMEGTLGPDDAIAFIRSEILGLERLISSLSERLGNKDPFVTLFRHCAKSVKEWYASKPPRCGN